MHTPQLDQAENYFFRASAKDFEKIPGEPLAYWMSEVFRELFAENETISSYYQGCQGLSTSDNPRFVRVWHEVSLNQISLPNQRVDEKWAPYNKGGKFRKWYGNIEFIVNWSNNGEQIKSLTPKSVVRNPSKYFLSSISWSDITSSTSAFRYYDKGFIFANSAHSAFPLNRESLLELSCFLNSKVTSYLIKAISPTMHFDVGYFNLLPFKKTLVDKKFTTLVEIAKQDWNNFETSWDFSTLPLLRPELKATTLTATWQNWQTQSNEAIAQMKELEEENNRLWIDAYGLQDELTPDVPEEEITLARADAKQDMAAFISYAVGCMFGRYSLDREGLILANAGETLEDYLERVISDQYRVLSESEHSSLNTHNSPLKAPSFMPDDDNIIPVLDGEWFEDDIVARFREFLRVTFGEETLQENIDFIESSLGKSLRKYFTSDFYKNHTSNERKYGYKKRPIYWMFSSPKKSFQALIYMHRYNRDTVNLLLNDYLREFQTKLENRKKLLKEIDVSESTSSGEKTRAKKEISKIESAQTELTDWERDILLPLAQQRIEIDLDDGVKQNYPKFGKALVKIPGVS